MICRRKILFSTALCAVAVRIVFAAAVFSSNFANYHLVPGLDMQTLLRFSRWGTGGDSTPFFTFHRLMIFLDWFIGGYQHHVWVIFAVQAIIGVIGSVCIADIVLKFSRHRITSLVCGITASAYLPFLVYEFSVLQETFAVNFSIFSFWAMLNAWHRRFSIGSSILFASTLFASLAGRPAAIIFAAAMIILTAVKMTERKILKKTLLPLTVFLMLMTAASLFNNFSGRSFSPFYNVMPYTLKYNAAPETPQKSATLIEAGTKAAKRVPQLFKTTELPENQNIYFWCKKIPQLHLLISPGMLMPCACAGIMIIIFSGFRGKHYFLLLLIPLATLAMPLCAREAIGRYRLMMVPYFFICAGCGFAIFRTINDPRKKAITLIAAAAAAFFSIHDNTLPQRIRLDDYHAYALAAANTPGKNRQEILDCFYEYWEKSNFKSPKAFHEIMNQCLVFKEFPLAFTAVKQAVEAKQVPMDHIRYFTAWCFALQQNPQKVLSLLQTIENPDKLPEDMQNGFVKLLKDTEKILNIRKK